MTAKALIASAERWVARAEACEQEGDMERADACMAIAVERYAEAAEVVEKDESQRPEAWK